MYGNLQVLYPVQVRNCKIVRLTVQVQVRVPVLYSYRYLYEYLYICKHEQECHAIVRFVRLSYSTRIPQAVDTYRDAVWLQVGLAIRTEYDFFHMYTEVLVSVPARRTK